MTKPFPDWLDAPEAHDYIAASKFLSLIFSTATTDKIVKRLKGAPAARYQAKDILRASGQKALNDKNPHVEHDLNKIRDFKKLSPILLVAGSGPLIIADGYHRVCACYLLDENVWVPCHIANIADGI
jgi:hypothetical protein